MLVLSLEFILQLVPDWYQITARFANYLKKFCRSLFIWTDWLRSIDCHLLETILIKREACRFQNSGAVSKKLKTGAV